jgi:hypothetical protein
MLSCLGTRRIATKKVMLYHGYDDVLHYYEKLDVLYHGYDDVLHYFSFSLAFIMDMTMFCIITKN